MKLDHSSLPEANKPTVAITYSRSSTKKQDLISQNEKLFRWAIDFDYHKHYQDYASSGKKDDRKGINKCVKYALKLNSLNKYDICIGVIELSRIGRSIGFICNTIEELAKHGIKVILVNTNHTIDYNVLEGRALMMALGMAAEIEWMLIQDRNARGRETIKKKGIKTGRKSILEKRGISMAAVLALRESGLSIRAIAAELKISNATVYRIIKSGQLRDNPESSQKTPKDPVVPINKDTVLHLPKKINS